MEVAKKNEKSFQQKPLWGRCMWRFIQPFLRQFPMIFSKERRQNEANRKKEEILEAREIRI